MTSTQESLKRKEPRYSANSNGTLILKGKTTPCIVANISRAGAMLQGVANLDIGLSFDLAVEGIGIMKATVTWFSEYGLGVSFAPPKLAADEYNNQMVNHLKHLTPLNDTKSIKGFW